MTSSQLDDRIRSLMQQVVDEAPPPPLGMPCPPVSPTRTRRSAPAWLIAAAAAALVVVLIGGVGWLVGTEDLGVGEEPPTGADITSAVPSTTPAPATQTVRVSVSGVSRHAREALAGVLYAGELTDLDDEALGGFSSAITDDDFTTTEVIRQPAEQGTGRFPFVSAEALTVEPGTYTLVLWVDAALNPLSRWVPINTDGQGLYGCHTAFEVGDEPQTDVAVTADLHPDGWNIDCATGAAIPGTDAAAAVAP